MVEVPITYKMTRGSVSQSKYFQRGIGKNDEDCKKFGNFIS